MLTKFTITGAINTAVDFLILNTCLFVFGLGFAHAYVVFKALGFIGAVTNSYFLNKYWVFKTLHRPTPKEGSLFLGVSLLGLVVNTAAAQLALLLLKLLPGGTHVVLLANIAALVGTGAVLSWNFWGYKYIVFSEPHV